ncbi:MAG TPA: hypothetical protein VKA21_03285 [Candidatus Binatia bacterium]|nr:hypothetical protein [Candidatus Binatia bacterium]
MRRPLSGTALGWALLALLAVASASLALEVGDRCPGGGCVCRIEYGLATCSVDCCPPPATSTKTCREKCQGPIRACTRTLRRPDPCAALVGGERRSCREALRRDVKTFCVRAIVERCRDGGFPNACSVAVVRPQIGPVTSAVSPGYPRARWVEVPITIRGAPGSPSAGASPIVDTSALFFLPVKPRFPPGALLVDESAWLLYSERSSYFVLDDGSGRWCPEILAVPRGGSVTCNVVFDFPPDADQGRLQLVQLGGSGLIGDAVRTVSPSLGYTSYVPVPDPAALPAGVALAIDTTWSNQAIGAVVPEPGMRIVGARVTLRTHDFADGLTADPAAFELTTAAGARLPDATLMAAQTEFAEFAPVHPCSADDGLALNGPFTCDLFFLVPTADETGELRFRQAGFEATAPFAGVVQAAPVLGDPWQVDLVLASVPLGEAHWLCRVELRQSGNAVAMAGRCGDQVMLTAVGSFRPDTGELGLSGDAPLACPGAELAGTLAADGQSGMGRIVCGYDAPFLGTFELKRRQGCGVFPACDGECPEGQRCSFADLLCFCA